MKKVITTRNLSAFFTSAALVAIAAGASPAYAQADPQESQAAQSGESDGQTNDIVVTAQRREERLSRVPVSVVAFGAEALQERNITSE